MSMLLELCAVIATLAVATIALMTVRAVRQFEEVARDFERTADVLRRSINEAGLVTRRVHELTNSLEAVVPPLKRAATRVEELSKRVVRLSDVVFDEVEGPIRTTLALFTGVRSGTRSLIEALSRRLSHAETNGGSSSE